MTHRITILFALFLAAFLPLASAQTTAKPLKVAVVDMNQVLKDYYKTQEVEARLKEVASGYEKELNDRRESYGKLVDQIRSLQDSVKDKSLSDEKRKEKEEALTEKIKEASVREQENKNFIQTATKLVRDQRQRAQENIMEEISKVVTSVSKAGSYNLVFVKAEFPSPVLYSDVADISADITKELNKSKPANAPAAAPSKPAAN